MNAAVSGAAAAAALAEARLWLGTPYCHQARCRGAGCDCLGLILGIWRALYGSLPAEPPPYSPDWAEAGQGEALLQAAQLWLVPKPLAALVPGDVLLFRIRDSGPARHLGLCSAVQPAPGFIHAYSGHAVTESPLSLPWRRRIAGCFAFPPIRAGSE